MTTELETARARLQYWQDALARARKYNHWNVKGIEQAFLSALDEAWQQQCASEA